MIIKEEMQFNSGVLFQGDRIIGVSDSGKVEFKYFVPDRFMYESVKEVNSYETKEISN